MRSEPLPGSLTEPLRRPLPWQRRQGLDDVLAGWQADPDLAANFVLAAEQPPVVARPAPLPQDLAPAVRAALASRGLNGLYHHQAVAYAQVAAGRHVVVATPTASGKSLCYNLPVLQRLCTVPQTRALYLFPTKALARDQEEALRLLVRATGLSCGAVTYDGDTPGDARRAAREQSGLILTNPDMLHAGIMPHHASWARFFASLAFVVVDELHTYRGVFGSHVANVLRRLWRIAEFHGARPIMIAASATLANAGEHATRLLGQPVTAVDENGAPQGRRHVRIYNPPVVNQELGIRASYLKSSVRLALDLIRAGVSTLIFGQSRNNVEIMLKYLRDRLGDSAVDPQSIQAYRGGYLPEARRRIEAGLRAGNIRCVVATNALELGVDIGSLDAVICAGYPGAQASLWQRFGRGGRRGKASLALLVTSSAPLDQYWAQQPARLLETAQEEARIDPDNVEILVQHLKCAAFELPFRGALSFGDVPQEAVGDALDYLVQHRVLHREDAADGARAYHWANEAYPANHVSLRQVGWDNFVIIDLARDKTMAELDWRSAHTMLHEQAIYQHAGAQYQVERLDYDNRKAYVRAVSPDYYTDAMTHTKLDVIDPAASVHLQAAPALVTLGWGEVKVVSKVVGYKKVKFHTHENVGYGDVRLPDMQMHTTACWLRFSPGALDALALRRADAIDGLRGLAAALHTVAAVHLMVDPRDLGRVVEDGGEHEARVGVTAFDPTLFLYDQVPGGVGLAERLFENLPLLLARTQALVADCRCSSGCPGCVGPMSIAAVAPVVTPPSIAGTPPHPPLADSVPSRPAGGVAADLSVTAPTVPPALAAGSSPLPAPVPASVSLVAAAPLPRKEVVQALLAAPWSPCASR